ncbi:MAG: hypothetical protein Q8N56_03950 [bacterium]|nr:hypothetical protein [bacterium]
MQFEYKKPQDNIANLARIMGYHLIGNTSDNEFNLVRVLAANGYPRFHLYLKEQNKNLLFNLHLDQKKPSYEGQTAHSGDYDSELVNAEKTRIQEAIAKGF